MKYKNITKNSPVDVYLDNLWLAVGDMYVEMVTQTGISTLEAKKLITRDVKFIMSDIERDMKDWLI